MLPAMENYKNQLSIFKFNISSMILWVIVIGCQTTDVTIGPLKIWEILILLLSFVLFRKIDKKVLYLFFVFTIIFIVSIVVSYYSRDHFDDYGGLKSKYLISVARYFELLLCCAVVSIMTFFRCKKINFYFLMRDFLFKNSLFCYFVLVLYFLDFLFDSGIVSYGMSHRLKGFYVEGGPFGLYVATLFLLSLFFNKNKWPTFFFFFMVIFCQSKAGYVMMAFSILLHFVLSVKQVKSFIEPRNFIKFSFFCCLSLFVVLSAVYFFANNYIEDASNISSIIDGRKNDKSLVMGRIAGSFIGYEIIKENTLLGVGLGNYSLVRNNEYYRQFFPAVDDWDLTGLGGVYNLFIENGVLGVSLFLLWFFMVFKFKNKDALFPVLFLCPFLLGAQLYMIYPWVYCSFYMIWCADENNF